MDHGTAGGNRRLPRARPALTSAFIATLLAVTGPLLVPLDDASAASVSAVPVRADPMIDETNASAAPGHLAWDQSSRADPGHFDVDTLIKDSTVRINAPGTQGLGGGIDGDTMVLEQYVGADHNIVLYHFSTGHRSGVPALNAWSGPQSHPTISGNWILLQRQKSNGFSWVVLYNRKSGRTRTIGHEDKPWKFVYAGQVSGNYAVWGLSTPAAWDIYVYDIAARTNTLIVRPKGVSFQYSPAVTPDGTVYYSRGGKGCGQNVRIMRRRPNGRTARLLSLPDLVDTGYMYAYQGSNSTTTLYFNRARCKDATDYVDHPWDIYKIKGAAG